MNCREKGATVRRILEDRDLSREEACYMGDDVNDLPAFNEVAYAIAPPEAVPEVLCAACYVTFAPAGHGAVREVCDMIIKARAATDSASG
jgi:3-deoxy-D-manno-octulosonate 8-phosphate phosphatase KdsC-like HAD superfamily phosphatase